jgi:hypothetical protein
MVSTIRNRLKASSTIHSNAQSCRAVVFVYILFNALSDLVRVMNGFHCAFWKRCYSVLRLHFEVLLAKRYLLSVYRWKGLNVSRLPKCGTTALSCWVYRLGDVNRAHIQLHDFRLGCAF